jgi:transcriptional regulator with XRE-family HTH domain
MTTLGERLKLCRQADNLTQTDIAKRLGVTLRSYQYYEKDEHPIPSDTLLKIANVFDVSLDWLLGRDVPRDNHRIDDIMLDDIASLQVELLQVTDKLGNTTTDILNIARKARELAAGLH